MAMEGFALECMQVEMGWGEWTLQVEHSSTGDRGWLHGWIHCIRPFVCVPQFELRFVMVRVGYGGVMVCHGHGRGGLGVHAGGDGVG